MKHWNWNLFRISLNQWNSLAPLVQLAQTWEATDLGTGWSCDFWGHRPRKDRWSSGRSVATSGCLAASLSNLGAEITPAFRWVKHGQTWSFRGKKNWSNHMRSSLPPLHYPYHPQQNDWCKVKWFWCDSQSVDGPDWSGVRGPHRPWLVSLKALPSWRDVDVASGSHRVRDITSVLNQFSYRISSGNVIIWEKPLEITSPLNLKWENHQAHQKYQYSQYSLIVCNHPFAGVDSFASTHAITTVDLGRTFYQHKTSLAAFSQAMRSSIPRNKRTSSKNGSHNENEQAVILVFFQNTQVCSGTGPKVSRLIIVHVGRNTLNLNAGKGKARKILRTEIRIYIQALQQSLNLKVAVFENRVSPIPMD